MRCLNPVPLAEVPDADIRKRFEHYENTRGFTPNSTMTMVRRPSVLCALMALNQAALTLRRRPDRRDRRGLVFWSMAPSGPIACL